MERRQHAADYRFREQGHLPFTLDTLFRLDRDRRHWLRYFDEDRLNGLNALLFDLDHGFTLARHLTSDASILPAIDQGAPCAAGVFKQRTKFLDGGKP